VPVYFPGGALPLKKKEKERTKISLLLVIYDTSSTREPLKVS
jgi:hypothetical protein